MSKEKGCTNWTELELNFLKDNYGTFKTNRPPLVLQARSSKAIRNKASQLGLFCTPEQRSKLRSSYTCDVGFFSKVSLFNSYWAGFIAADGCVDESGRLRVVLSSKDVAHLYKLKEALEYTGFIYYYRNMTGYKKTKMCRLEICCGKQLVTDLDANFLITPRKTYTLQPPVGLPRLYAFSYLLGLIDGDGSSYYSSDRLTLELLGTEEVMLFAKSVLSFFALDKIESKIRCVGGAYNLRISGKKAERIKASATALGLPLLGRKWAP